MFKQAKDGWTRCHSLHITFESGFGTRQHIVHGSEDDHLRNDNSMVVIFVIHKIGTGPNPVMPVREANLLGARNCFRFIEHKETLTTPTQSLLLGSAGNAYDVR